MEGGDLIFPVFIFHILAAGDKAFNKWRHGTDHIIFNPINLGKFHEDGIPELIYNLLQPALYIGCVCHTR
eukprot:9890508-Ditylum_brightwellii.AAC.2